ncbi:porin [Hyphomicrobium sp.]|uniref:porin n=1 Tax=Hyphomicrobium sp. TaxID=82 RepID=UPI002E330415|nr:porin [Hyphomicrobium sp.]HEX2841593.1 porin [Hyphomicrobium sp.]
MRRRSASPIFQFAIASAVCICAGYAEAADLSGDCCADLDERIAELEATAARKGTRKVKLTMSGYVAQEITGWDDGGKSNVYLHGLGPTQATHIKFNGEATISPGWTAGYMMRIQNLDDNPFGRSGTAAITQDRSAFSQGLNVQMSYWYLQSKALGTVSVGRQAPAAKSAAMFTDQSGTQIIDNYTFLDGFPQFIIRSGGDLSPAALTWGQLAFCYSQSVPLGGDCDGLVMNAVRYDTPVIAGFSASASWGEDDDWQVAARYAGEFSGFKVLLGIGYSGSTDERLAVALPNLIAKDSSYFQAGGYAEHLATGLFLHGAYGYEDNSGTLLAGDATPPDGEHWYVKVGIRRKWTPLGATVVYGDYGQYIDQIGPSALALGVRSSEIDLFGGGVVQELDSASMSLWLKYRNQSANISGASGVGPLDDFRALSTGALIRF